MQQKASGYDGKVKEEGQIPVWNANSDPNSDSGMPNSQK
jgi:hypothetical protein